MSGLNMGRNRVVIIIFIFNIFGIIKIDEVPWVTFESQVVAVFP